ncbi:MAG: T9SS type A sorting domain-containing protein [candidate division Zixibacteria bacterium]|nr:T9SS type A sorting domain-containing protein [candidate division Zixibacteria bacterium]
MGGSNPDVDYSCISGYFPGPHNIYDDPLFRDANNGDYHLQSLTNPNCGGPGDSPCIDAGDPTILDASLSCDWGLGTRTSDMGAYGGGDRTPVISNMTRVPEFPIEGETCQISAIITDETGYIDEARLHGSIGGPFYSMLMDNVADSFFATAPALPRDVTASYYIVAYDEIGDSTVSDTLSYTVLAAPCCDVDMETDEYPVNVPPGGSFGLTGFVGNPALDPILTDVWVGVRKAGAFMQLYNFQNIPIAPGITLSSHLVQSVPVTAQPGVYEYVAFCGDFNSWAVCDSASFEFTVTGAPLANGAIGWLLDGQWGEGTNMPDDYNLLANYPNPFNATTTIAFELPEACDVNLNIYNLAGRKVATLIDGFKDSGFHNISWDASQYSSGIYFYKLSTGNKIFTKRMTLLK